MQLVNSAPSGLPVVPSTAPTPPPAIKAFAQRLADREKRNARTEQRQGSGRSPQTTTSTLHQINNFYWFPRSLPSCQVTLPWNAPACPGSGAEPGNAVPGGISGSIQHTLGQAGERKTTIHLLGPSSKDGLWFSPAGHRQGWGRQHQPQGEQRFQAQLRGPRYKAPVAQLQPTVLFQRGDTFTSLIYSSTTWKAVMGKPRIGPDV